MAVFRQIQTSFWQDDFVLSLTPEEKYFYIYLFTNSKTKQCGIYELPLQVASLDTGYNRETIIKLIQKFIEFGKIAYDWETKELAIKNWMKYNPTNNPKVEACVTKELSQIKNKSLIEFIKYPLEWVSQEEEEEEKEKEEEYSDFEMFWDIYDKKRGKPNTLKLWKKLTQSEKESIFVNLPLYVKATPDVAFRKDPERYIKHRVWEDEIVTYTKPTNSFSKPTLGEYTTYDEILKFTQNESAEFRKSIFDKYEALGNGKFKLKK